MLRLVGLRAENIKKLKLVDVKFDKDHHVVKISGMNEQGKSSLMDGLAWALGGAETFKDFKEPIHHGAERAEVIVDLEDIKVRRVWTSNTKSYLSVENKDGAEYKSPQNMLDAMVGKLAFDPAAFAGMKSDKQLETLLALVPIGIDLKAHAADRKKVFDERTVINRDKTDLEGQLKLMDDPGDVPTEEVSASAILAEQAAAQKVIAEHDQTRRLLETHSSDIVGVRSNIKSTEDAIADLKKQLAMYGSLLNEQNALLTKYVREADDIQKTVSALVDPDLTVFATKIAESEALNKKIRAKKTRAELLVKLDSKVKDSTDKTLALEQRDTKKADALKAAKMPIEALTFDDDGIRYKGIPFNQCSSEEKLRVSLAMGIAMNPKLRLMFIRDGSLLDKKNRAVIEEMAKEHDFLVLMEVVDEKGGPAVLVIEDGMVKEGANG